MKDKEIKVLVWRTPAKSNQITVYVVERKRPRNGLMDVVTFDKAPTPAQYEAVSAKIDEMKQQLMSGRGREKVGPKVQEAVAS